MRCARCHQENPERSKFCLECGTRLALYCHACACEIPAEAKFCNECGHALTAEPTTPPRPDAETRFQAMLRAVMWTLQHERRTTYRELTHLLGLDQAILAAIRDELTFKRLAHDEEGMGLVWTGEPLPVIPPVREIVGQPATDPTPAVPRAASPATPRESPRPLPEAERRQLTVMFCDLAEPAPIPPRPRSAEPCLRLRRECRDGARSKKCVHRSPDGRRSTTFSTSDQVTKSVMPLVVPWPGPRKSLRSPRTAHAPEPPGFEPNRACTIFLTSAACLTRFARVVLRPCEGLFLSSMDLKWFTKRVRTLPSTRTSTSRQSREKSDALPSRKC